MVLSNLPPGMSERDIPGNSLKDQLWDDFIESEIAPLKADLEDWLAKYDDPSPMIQEMHRIFQKHLSRFA